MKRKIAFLLVAATVLAPVTTLANNDARCRAAYANLGHLNPFIPAGGDRRVQFDPVIVVNSNQFDRVNTDRCIVASYQGVIDGRHTILVWSGLLKPPLNRYLEPNIQHELAHAEGWRH